MQLLVLGINHVTASVELREKLAIAPEKLIEAKRSLQSAISGSSSASVTCEVVIVSTCNRTELVMTGEIDENMLARSLEWLADCAQISVARLSDHTYRHHAEQALSHLLKVGSGLDSMVLGEPQILGQVKSAYAAARKADTLGPVLDSVFQHLFSVVKKVRTQTAIGENPVSVAYAAVMLAQRIFTDLSQVSALLIGAGETVELVAAHMKNEGVREMTIANRTIDNAIDLANSLQGHAMLLADIPQELHRFDVVISSTGSQLPILGKGAVEQALKKRKRQPMFLVDIAVPRDIEAQVGELPDAYLYSVDDLKDIIDHNMQLRVHEADKASQIIAEGVDAFRVEHQQRQASDLVVAYRQQISGMSAAELARAKQLLQSGQSPEQVLEGFAHGLTRKIMHGPTIVMREAAGKQDMPTLDAARQLFSLDD